MIRLGDDGFPVGVPSAYGYRSLGPGVLLWGHKNLRQPDGVNAGDPWRWRTYQIRFAFWWYAVDETGRFLYDRAQLVLPKGSGKSPFAAALSLAELCGPVVLDRFTGAPDTLDGGCAGVPHPSPWLQLAAVSEDQTVNTMSIALAMSSHWEMPGFDPGLTRVYVPNGRLEPVTASAPSREGQRLTAAVLDETQHWRENNGGHRLAATIRRNLAKMGGRSIETTNAWQAGEESVAERTSADADLAAEGRTRTARILRMHPKATVPDLGDENALRDALADLYGDMPWIDRDRIVAEVYDRSNHPSDMRRYYLNEPSSVDDALITAAEWDACPVVAPLADDDVITLGFDGSKSLDATALVACRISDWSFHPVAVWEPPRRRAARGEANWEVPADEVDATIRRTFDRYRVKAFYADMEQWESYVDLWSRDLRRGLAVKASPSSAVGWDMRGRLRQSTYANERLLTAIRETHVSFGPGPVLRRHALNARRHPNRWGVSFRKASRDSPDKVDAYAAMLLSDMARHDLLASGYRAGSSGKGRIIVLH